MQSTALANQTLVPKQRKKCVRRQLQEARRSLLRPVCTLRSGWSPTATFSGQQRHLCSSPGSATSLSPGTTRSRAAAAGSRAASPSQQLPPPRGEAEADLGQGRRAQRPQTHLALIASATAKQLMAGKRRRNRALGERKGWSKPGENSSSFLKERGTICRHSCGGLTCRSLLLEHLFCCTQTTTALL